MIYLSEVEEGGATGFINLRLNIDPHPGRLLAFHNCYRGSASLHPDSLHAGCPVIKGTKWAVSALVPPPRHRATPLVLFTRAHRYVPCSVWLSVVRLTHGVVLAVLQCNLWFRERPTNAGAAAAKRRRRAAAAREAAAATDGDSPAHAVDGSGAGEAERGNSQGVAVDDSEEAASVARAEAAQAVALHKLTQERARDEEKKAEKAKLMAIAQSSSDIHLRRAAAVAQREGR